MTVMHVDCPHCHRVLEFSNARPSFCAYCGHALATSREHGDAEATFAVQAPPPGGPPNDRGISTIDFDPAVSTLSPEIAHADTSAPAPQRIGAYRVIREIGRGGMGKVYEAEESSSKRRVALKLISPEFATSHEAIERFRREGQLAGLISHPRCVFVLAADEEAGQPYIVMELMPGSTLQDLVGKQGPLPVDQAVAKILDVIEGLQEAHQLGVIHRDVKPSNCFLEADGRVKVGDFGLSKSLVGDFHLTRTGTFLGTPLFASPEQIRKDPLDQQTDVYSVAATLYFLLVGQAPFQGTDAAATLARIVSDPVPPMCNLRPEIPAGLDRVVLRGLERQRERRWRSLEEFREALLPFVPGHLSIGGMGVRFGAYLIDYFLITLLTLPIGIAVHLITGEDQFNDPAAGARPHIILMTLTVWVLYFGLSEGRWGCSPGKWLLRLRIRALGSDRPSLPQALLRAFCFYILLKLGTHAGGITAFLVLPPHANPAHLPWDHAPAMWIAALALIGGYAIGLGLLFAPMHSRSGYRGLHEILSRTRVVRLPWPHRRRTYMGRPVDQGLTQPVDMPAKVGSFRILGAVSRETQQRVLLGDDAVLGRKVWLWFRPCSERALEEARRSLSRAGRPRWLAHGEHESWQWDALVASAGTKLPDLLEKQGRLAWPDARPILEQTTEELFLALQDGTMPRRLTIDQVWILPNGGVQLLDFLPSATLSCEREIDPLPDGNDWIRTVTFLRQTALLLLEGQPVAAQRRDGVQAPLPQHAAKLMNRLLDSKEDFGVTEFRADLEKTRDQPREVSAARRITHLILLAVLLLPGLLVMFGSTGLADIVMPLIASAQVPVNEKGLWVLEVGATRDFIFSATSHDQFIQLGGWIQLDADLRLRDQVQQKLARIRSEREARLASLSWYAKLFVATIDKKIKEQMEEFTEEQIRQSAWSLPQESIRKKAEEALEFDLPLGNGEAFFGGLLPLLIVVAPIVWILWAMVARGGLGFRLMGICLVRSNGRRALLLQCAWRALLFWLPVTAFLMLSSWLDALYWLRWPDQSPPGALLWLSWLSWWIAAAVLPAYVALAAWLPNRSVHDHLAGTYLVPR